jgi:rare lipoprotein A
MNKLLKSMSITLTGAMVIMLYIGCTPGKAQTRGNDYKGSFQNEEFEAFDRDSSSNDDEIPSLDKSRESYPSGKYANNSNNNKMRVKSDAENNGQSSKSYKEVKGKYSDSENYDDESDNRISSKKNSYEDDTEQGETVQEKFYQKGLASWYGREFHGKTTASGEKFDMNEMTAAHKTLPFGTIVEVKNLENGKSVRLKINDRGPYRGNRIIDLSFGGAKEIGIVKTGEANVGIKVLKMGDSGSAVNENNDKRYVEPVADDETYTNVKSERQNDYSDSIKLQAGAFYSKRNAENLKNKIEGMTDRPVKVVQDGDFFKVRVEGLRDKKEMNKLKGMLSEDSISSFAVE